MMHNKTKVRKKEEKKAFCIVILNSRSTITRNLLGGKVVVVDFIVPWNKEEGFSFFSLRKRWSKVGLEIKSHKSDMWCKYYPHF